MHGVVYEAKSEIDAINLQLQEGEDENEETEISSSGDLLASKRR